MRLPEFARQVHGRAFLCIVDRKAEVTPEGKSSLERAHATYSKPFQSQSSPCALKFVGTGAIQDNFGLGPNASNGLSAASWIDRGILP